MVKSRSFGQFASTYMGMNESVPLSYLQVVDTTRTYAYYNIGEIFSLDLPLVERALGDFKPSFGLHKTTALFTPELFGVKRITIETICHSVLIDHW